MKDIRYDEATGLWWPEQDTETYHWICEVDGALPHWVAEQCAKKRTIIQAGGNCGLYANLHAEWFDTVVTIEPDPINFRCLAMNCTNPRILPLRAALADTCGRRVGMVGGYQNCGARQTAEGSEIRTLTIDALGLDDVDCIHLDVEGDEMAAIRGAAATIARCRPAIVLELNERAVEKGWGEAALAAKLTSFGYQHSSIVGDNHCWLPGPEKVIPSKNELDRRRHPSGGSPSR